MRVCPAGAGGQATRGRLLCRQEVARPTTPAARLRPRTGCARTGARCRLIPWAVVPDRAGRPRSARHPGAAKRTGKACNPRRCGLRRQLSSAGSSASGPEVAGAEALCAAERRLQRAQLASDVAALDRLIDDRLVVGGTGVAWFLGTLEGTRGRRTVPRPGPLHPYLDQRPQGMAFDRGACQPRPRRACDRGVPSVAEAGHGRICLARTAGSSQDHTARSAVR